MFEKMKHFMIVTKAALMNKTVVTFGGRTYVVFGEVVRRIA